jgi:tetratricopeptide (TPR) repeat protein
MKPQDFTDLPKITSVKQPPRALKSQNLISVYSVFFPLFLAILFITLTPLEILENGEELSLRIKDSIIASRFLTGLTFGKLFIRFDRGYKMDELAKWVSEMVQKFPDPDDFIKEIEKTDKPDKDKGDYFYEIGDRLIKISNFKLALKIYDKALAYYLKFNNRAGEAKCYSEFGNTYNCLGDFQKAIEYHNKALRIFIEINNKAGESKCYNNLGIAYRNLSDCKKAIENHEKSLKMFKEIGDKLGEADSYANLGGTYYGLGDFKKMVEYSEKSLKIFKELGDKSGESKCYATLGCAYYSLGDCKKAIEYLEKSLKIYIENGYRDNESRCYMFLGSDYDKLGDFKKSVEYYNKALEGFEKTRNIYYKKICLGNMGEAYLDRENFEQSERYYKQAVEILENMRRENIPNEYKRSYWKNNIPIFDNLIISDVKLEKKEEALENSERGKGRTVSDFILGRGIEEKGFKPEPLNFKEIQELVERIQKNLVLFRVTEKGTFAFIVRPSPFSSPTDGERRGEGTDGFELLEFPEFNAKRLEELVLKLESDLPSPNGLRQASKPVSGWIHAYSNYKSVQENVNRLRAEKGYVEVGRTIKEAEGTWFKTMDETLKIIYDELMGKVFSRLKKGEKVVIIPNRALNILPLHACFYEEYPSPNPSPTRGEGFKEISSPSMGEDRGEGEKRFKRHYLIEDYDINYAPNCNILDLCHKREAESREERAGRRKDSLFAIANPAPPYELAFSEWEVEEIAKLFDSKEVFCKQAAKGALVNNADSYDVIHLSTHGIYDLGSSFNSRLRLGKDSDLTLEEIFEKVRINKSWLVCLSACESGLTDYRDIADEYIGLQTGFLCAGAPTVIASLWTINDFPTAFIMIKTYEYIFKQGLKKSEALRKAQLWLKELTAEDALIILKDKELELESSVKMAVKDISPLKVAISSKDPKSKPFSHPYYWAGFQAIGA